MGTRIRVDHDRLDDQNYWDEAEENTQPRRKAARRNRRREIEDRMESDRLHRTIASSYEQYDA